MTDQCKPYRVEVTISAARDGVWRAMTDPEQIRQWFGWDYEGLDGEIRHIFADHVVLDPPARMSFEDGSFIELVADGERTIVRAVLPGPLDEARWDEIYDGIEEGWRSFLEQLRFLLEIRPQGRRRTVYLTGTATGPDALALAGTDGQSWHTSRYQRMSIDAAGHLVGVAAQAPLDSDSIGPVAVTISTYGLDDAAFTALRDTWARRWSAVTDARVTTDAGETTPTSP